MREKQRHKDRYIKYENRERAIDREREGADTGQREEERETQTDRQKDRPTDTPTDRQTDRDRQTKSV